VRCGVVDAIREPLGKLAIILLKICLSVGLAWLAFRKIDLGSVWGTLRAIAPWSLGVAAALFFLQFGLGAMRLQELLEALGVRYGIKASLDAVLVGAFFSQTLISFVGGDAMRVWRIVRSRVAVGVAARSILLDRVSGFAGLFVLLIAAAPFLPRLIASPELLAGAFLIVLGALSGIAGAFLVRRLPAPLARRKAIALAKDFTDTGLRIWRSRRGATLVTGLSIAIQLANVAILLVLAAGLGLRISVADGFLLFPTVLFLSMLPISVAGWGVREGAMVTALSLVGVPPHQSLALSVSFGLGLVAVSLPGGAVWLASRRASLRREPA